MKKPNVTINASKLAHLCFAWTLFLLLGISMGLNLPFILAVIGTVLYLVG